MKPDEKMIGEAVRIEFDPASGKLFLVFEIKDEMNKKMIRENWNRDDLEFRILERTLVLTNE